MGLLYALPPVGDPIEWRAGEPDRPPEALFAPYRTRFYGSGTSALAAAIAAAAALAGLAHPEVVLPAYGCPDLVAAARCAGVVPVLVDLAPDRPWIDLELLAGALSARTVAVVAVDLFGIPERIAAIRALIEGSGTFLIEDAAQASPLLDAEDPHGDFVILSFGRGKPVSLLSGGAVLTREPHLHAALPAPQGGASEGRRTVLRFAVRAALYNLLTHPRLYGWVSRMPFLHIGETRYQPLERVEPPDVAALTRLAANLQAYARRGAASRQDLHAHLGSVAAQGFVDLPLACAVPPAARLLRYPLLLPDPGLRDTLYRALDGAGLGASCMYPAPLPDLPGLHGDLASGRAFPQAQSFAGRILTLPLHARTSARDLAVIDRILEDYLD